MAFTAEARGRGQEQVPESPSASEDPAIGPLPAERPVGVDGTGAGSVGQGEPEEIPEAYSTFSSDAASGDLDFIPEAFYQMEDEFARGGLGRISKARDRRLGRTVAVKELLSKDPKAEGRFVREAMITARLQHPSIVPVHEAGRWPSGKRFYAMKLVEGRTLSKAMEAAKTREDRLSLLPHLIDVADAVAYAHSQGILHRDLKPGNVMVGPFGETVVIDWGLAKDLWAGEDEIEDGPLPPRSTELTENPNSSDLVYTSDGIVVGTPPYMSPEQARAQPVDERSDVYALGAMLYHVLCGRRPYQQVPARDILRAVVSGPPKPVEQMAPDLPRDLVAIVQKAMARDPEHRYPSAREMAEELRRFSAGQLVRAHDYSPVEILNRFVRKNFGTVSIAVTAVVMLIAFGVWSFEALRQERDRAHAAAERERLRSQELILEEADHLLDEDPTASLAWLLRLDDPARLGAASIASEAEFRGVARWVDRGFDDSVEVAAAGPKGKYLAWSGSDGGIRWLDLQSETFVTARGHEGRVTALAFSADGRHLASAGYDDTVRLWSLQSPQRPAAVLRGHGADVHGVVFAELGGTTRLASVASRSLKLWSETGRLAAEWETPAANRGLDVQAGGDRLASGGYGNEVWVWDGASGAHDVHRCDSRRVDAFALSADGRSLACGGTDGRVRWIDLESGRVRRFGVRGGPAVLDLAFSSDGQRLVSTHFDGAVGLHRVGRDTRWLPGHSQRVVQARFSPDGRWLATGGWDDPVRLTHLPTGDARELLGHEDTIAALAFSADGRWLLSGSWDGSARIWPLGDHPVERWTGHTVGVHAVAFSPDGRWVASGGHDNLVLARNRETGEVKVFEGHEDHVYRVSFHPNGRWIASSSDDRTVRLWSLDGDEPRILRGHEADVEELAFSSDGQWLASAGEDHRVILWPMKSLSGPRQDSLEGIQLVGHDDFVSDVAMAGGWLASSGRDGTVWLWELPDGPEGRPRGRKVLDLDAPAWSLAFGPQGRELAVAGADALTVLEVRTGEVVMQVDGLSEAHLVRFSPSLSVNRIAVTSSGKAWWLCERAFQRCRTMFDHDGTILDVDFHPKEPILAVGSADTSIRLWDLEREEYRTLRGHQLNVFDVEFSPEGDVLASGSADADVRLWDVELPPPNTELRPWIRARTSYRVDTSDLRPLPAAVME